jgi:hypothetical protein
MSRDVKNKIFAYSFDLILIVGLVAEIQDSEIFFSVISTSEFENGKFICRFWATCRWHYGQEKVLRWFN